MHINLDRIANRFTRFCTGDEIKEEECGPIDVPKTVADVRQEPLPLPAGFEWCETNVDDEKTVCVLVCLCRGGVRMLTVFVCLCVAY